MGSKTRGNYPTGGWCGRRERCLNDGVSCAYCIRFSEFEDFEEVVEEVDNTAKKKNDRHQRRSVAESAG